MKAPLAAILVALILAGCAGRLRRENALALATADARVLEGCRECLVEARDIYQRLDTSRHVARDTIALRLFETNVLLSLREKELQRDWRPALERAKALAPRVPAVDARRILADVEAVRPDGTGRPGDWPQAGQSVRSAFAPRVAAEVAWIATAPLRPAVRDYLALALDCSYDARVLAPRKQPGATRRRPVLTPGAPPIITYRTGICLSPDTNMLAAARALVPAFHEAAYHAGVAAAFGADEDGGDAAAKLLDEAYAHFPDAPGVTFMAGWLAEETGDCTSAVRRFDETIATDSAHEYAHLQRTICLSRLHQDSAAIASATRLIALNTGSTQQGYYWRAVSRLRLQELLLARNDIETAKAIARDANALTLAGVIENEQNDLAVAETDLKEARALPMGDYNCTAAWTLGLVLGKSARPGDAADAFEGAMDCHDVKVAEVRYRIERLREHPPSNAGFLQRRLDALEADSTDQRTRYFASAFNAAGHRANSGNLARGLELLDIAARGPQLAEPVARMREAIVAAQARLSTPGSASRNGAPTRTPGSRH